MLRPYGSCDGGNGYIYLNLIYNSCQMKSRINFFNVLFFKGKDYKVR